MYKFTESQYQEFKTFLFDLNKVNWGAWNPSTWLHFPELPGYSIHQYQQDNDITFVVVKFDSQVETPYSKGKRFKVGGGRNYQPVCDRF